MRSAASVRLKIITCSASIIRAENSGISEIHACRQFLVFLQELNFICLNSQVSELSFSKTFEIKHRLRSRNFFQNSRVDFLTASYWSLREELVKNIENFRNYGIED